MIRLRDVATLISGQHVLASNVNNDGAGLPYLTGPSDFVGYVPRATSWTARGTAFAEPGDILITVKGSGCGTMTVADQRYAISRQLMAVRAARCDGGFLWAALRREIARLKSQSTGTIPGLTRDQVLNISLPDVSDRTQQAVASLDTCSTRHLLQHDKYVRLKKELILALMEQLLLGRRRFPDFLDSTAISNGLPSGWRVLTLGQIASVRVSSVDKHSTNGEIPVRLCNYLDVWTKSFITSDMPFMGATATQGETERFGLRAGDVLLTKDSETRDEIAKSSVVLSATDDLVLGYHLALIRPDPTLADGRFLAAQLRLPRFRDHFLRGAQGATRFGLTIERLRSATVWLPQVAEQKRIADFERYAYEEVERLSRIQHLYSEQQRALMHHLLSGDIENLAPAA